MPGKEDIEIQDFEKGLTHSQSSSSRWEIQQAEKKAVTTEAYSENDEDDQFVGGTAEVTQLSFLSRIAVKLNAETKGIEPVTDEEKTDDSVINAASMWFSANMVIALMLWVLWVH